MPAKGDRETQMLICYADDFVRSARAASRWCPTIHRSQQLVYVRVCSECRFAGWRGGIGLESHRRNEDQLYLLTWRSLELTCLSIFSSCRTTDRLAILWTGLTVGSWPSWSSNWLSPNIHLIHQPSSESETVLSPQSVSWSVGSCITSSIREDKEAWFLSRYAKDDSVGWLLNNLLRPASVRNCVKLMLVYVTFTKRGNTMPNTTNNNLPGYPRN